MALSAALRKYDGLWFGWSGETVEHWTGEVKIEDRAGVTVGLVDLEWRPSIPPGGRAAWCRPGSWGIDTHGCDNGPCGALFIVTLLWGTPRSGGYRGNTQEEMMPGAVLMASMGIQLIERQ